VGPGRFHYATTPQDVDTVYLGTFDKSIVEEVGGYDTELLQWAAEDQELAYRLRERGRRVRLDPRIRSQYFPRHTPRALWRQYFNYGMCKASTLQKHRRLPTWRPLAPAGLVAGSVIALVVGLVSGRPLLGVAPSVAYVVGIGVVATRLSDESGVQPHRVALATGICHVSYGLGFWSGMWRIVRSRPFDTSPKA
jgi:hypothetical protein